MLFPVFFPRLCDHARERYGETVTERQFKDWREDGLLPGPAAPKGRGRGRSPERHWPIASYRRALRICRYKSWGARRQSQWWLGFWLSGETVAPDKIRHSLMRELRFESGKNRSFINSNRWANTAFKTIADARRGGLAGNSNIAGLLALTDMTPDQYRRTAILQLNEFSGDDPEKLIHEMAPLIFDLGAEFDAETTAKAFADIQADIPPEEIKQALRFGHLDRDGVQPGKYLEEISDSELAICVKVLRLREQSARWSYAVWWLSGERSQKQILIYLIPVLWSRVEYLEYRISQLIKIAFEIEADIRDGHSSTWRLDGIENSIAQLRTISQELASKYRRDLLT